MSNRWYCSTGNASDGIILSGLKRHLLQVIFDVFLSHLRELKKWSLSKESLLTRGNMKILLYLHKCVGNCSFCTQFVLCYFLKSVDYSSISIHFVC